jgi:hypothetical protein
MRAKDLLGLEQEQVVVVATSGEEFAVRTTSNAADLLGVTADPRQQYHTAMPVKQISLILVRPLNRVKVDVPHLIANQELLRVHKGIGIPYRAAALCGGSEADIGDRCGLFTVEARFRILWAPECDPTIATPDGEDS